MAKKKRFVFLSKKFYNTYPISLADAVVRIEMGNIDSLNVAVAGGILMNHYRG